MKLGKGVAEKNRRFITVGFPKCGQVSMQDYLDKRFGKIKRAEIGWRDDAVEKWNDIVRNFKEFDLTPVFAIREPIQRMWSAWTYFGKSHAPDFPTYLINRLYQPYGEGNPIMASNYWKYIRKFEKFNPIVLDLEAMSANPDFPKLNTTAEVKFKNDTVPEFPDHYRKLAQCLFDLELKGKFWKGDHITGTPTPDAWKFLDPYNPAEIRRNTYRDRA